MKIRSVLALVAAFGVFNSVAFAGDGCCKGAAKSTAQTVSDKGACEKSCSEAAAKCMPQISIMVGEKSFQCPVEAASFAKKEKGTVVYMVAHKKYEDQEKAMVAYADVLDEYAANFAKVRTQEECMASCTGEKAATCSKGAACCKAGETKTETKATAVKTEVKSDAKSDAKTAAMFCVAGRCVADKAKAQAIADKAAEAMKTVAMKYDVDGKSYCCDKMAGEAVAKAGKSAKMMYVVGETKTECKVQGRIALAKAKVMAAMAATAEKEESKKVATKA